MPDPTPGDTVTGPAVREIADLTRAAERARHVLAVEPGDLVVRVLHRDERIETLDLEAHGAAPSRPRGGATLWSPTDFISYVQRLGGISTTLWANPDTATIAAIFNDHKDCYSAGWRDHTAVLDVRRDPEWQAWTGLSGRLMGQEDFADFLEQHAHAVVRPDAATMLEVATTFQATRSAEFQRATRLQSGDVQLRFAETTSARAGQVGDVEIPAEFVVRVAPFWGVEPVEMVARLRYRLRDGTLAIGFQLHRPDVAEREAFDRIRAQVIEHLDFQAHLGPAPAGLR